MLMYFQLCGEVVLFCMDYSVNQATNGAQLYRMHDDFWLWSKDHDEVVKGWEAINIFSEIMGVSLSKAKTGTVRIIRDHAEPQALNPTLISDPSVTKPIARQPAPISPKLPQGEIRWGFLSMDSVAGRFIIDQDMVDTHIQSLQTQLADKSNSIFGWIQAWNTYAGTFFKTNFGKPANCYGHEHVDMLLDTMKRIQTRIFNNSNVVQYLKSEIHKRLDVHGVPDGYLYFPTHLGGLELQNPFIGLLQVRNSVCDSPASVLDKVLEQEQEAYRKAKIAWEAGKVQRSNPRSPAPANSSTFFSFEEFSKHHEEFYAGYEGNLLGVYEELLQQPVKEDVDFDIESEGGGQLCWNKLNDAGMEDREKRWIAMTYGREMIDLFGGLEIVDKGLLPMGIVGLFGSGKVKWQD